MVNSQSFEVQSLSTVETAPPMKFNSSQELFIRTITRSGYLSRAATMFRSIFSKAKFSGIVFGPRPELLKTGVPVSIKIPFVCFFSLGALIISSIIRNLFQSSLPRKRTKEFSSSVDFLSIPMIVRKGVFVRFDSILCSIFFSRFFSRRFVSLCSIRIPNPFGMRFFPFGRGYSPLLALEG